MRDVVANRVPRIVDPDGVYAAPAFLGAGTTVLVLHLEFFTAVNASIVAGLVLTLRLLALRYHWRIRLAARGRRRAAA